MPTIKEINAEFSAVAPSFLSEPWDNDGVMLCGEPVKNIKKAVACLEINEAAVDFAIEKGAELIVTHHPYIFRPLKRIGGGTFDVLSKLMTAGISVLSYHTRLDKAKGGVNDALADALGLSDVTPYGENGEDEEGMGRIGILPGPMSTDDFIEYVSERLGAEGIRYTKGVTKPITRVAVLGGAGKDFLGGAASVGADAFVSADLSHNTFIDAAEMNVLAVDAGHYYTENPIVERIAGLLSDFGVEEVSEFDVGSPFN